jgi:acetyltransferase-like isoleucine patch superfamily enzyme
MDKLTLRRWHQVFNYGWPEAAVIAKETGKSRLTVFLDIISSFSKWHVFSNQFHAHRLWELPEKEKEDTAKSLGEENKRRDNWVRENYHNWKFINKWTDLKYELSPSMQQKRKKAYTKEFNAGEGLIVQFNVHIHREHYLDGTIKIGRNVLLAKNVFIDYSGFLEIEDNVALSDGVVIETHSHVSSGFALKGKGKLDQTHLVIEEGVSVGSKAMIMDTCSKVGRHSRIGAGAVVRSNVPPYAIVIGNPAKIVGFIMTPEEVAKKELDYPEEKRINMEKFVANYDRYFRGRVSETKKYVKL